MKTPQSKLQGAIKSFMRYALNIEVYGISQAFSCSRLYASKMIRN